MKNALLYNGVFLMKNSQAHELLTSPPQGSKSSQPNNIQFHMKMLDAKQHALEGVVTRDMWNIGQGYVKL